MPSDPIPLAWTAYLVSGGLLFLIIALLTRHWQWRRLRKAVLLVLAVVLFTPAAGILPGTLAPATPMAVFAFLQNEFEVAENAAINLGMVALILLLMMALQATLRRLFDRS